MHTAAEAYFLPTLFFKLGALVCPDPIGAVLTMCLGCPCRPIAVIDLQAFLLLFIYFSLLYGECACMFICK